MMQKTVVIDCFPESVRKYQDGYSVVAIDVIRATTTAITAVASGRQCYPVTNVESAWVLTNRLTDPLLVGEIGGFMPNGFHMNNSPAQLAQQTDTGRPVILLSSSGTRLIHEARQAEAVYIACLRNYRTQIEYLANHHSTVALIGAGSRNEFREEDKLCCAWIARGLFNYGYEPEDARTSEIVAEWGEAPVESILGGNSVSYLRRSGQESDVEFILTHVEDIHSTFRLENEEIICTSESKMAEEIFA